MGLYAYLMRSQECPSQSTELLVLCLTKLSFTHLSNYLRAKVLFEALVFSLLTVFEQAT